MKGARRDKDTNTHTKIHTHIIVSIDICFEVGYETANNLQVPILTSIVQGSVAILQKDNTDEGREEGQ